MTRDELVLDYLATHDPVAVLFAAYPATAVAVRAAGLVGEDLDQTLAVGVVKAARTYDEARGVPFWFHARPHLRAAVQRAIGESEEKTRFHAAAWRLGAWRPGKDDNDDWTPALYRHADRRPGPEAAADAADAVAALRAGLSGREWRVLAMRYGLTTGGVPLDTRAVAAAEGVSRQMTNRVERRAVEKARRLLGAA